MYHPSSNENCTHCSHFFPNFLWCKISFWNLGISVVLFGGGRLYLQWYYYSKSGRQQKEFLFLKFQILTCHFQHLHTTASNQRAHPQHYEPIQHFSSYTPPIQLKPCQEGTTVFAFMGSVSTLLWNFSSSFQQLLLNRSSVWYHLASTVPEHKIFVAGMTIMTEVQFMLILPVFAASAFRSWSYFSCSIH